MTPIEEVQEEIEKFESGEQVKQIVNEVFNEVISITKDDSGQLQSTFGWGPSSRPVHVSVDYQGKDPIGLLDAVLLRLPLKEMKTIVTD